MTVTLTSEQTSETTDGEDERAKAEAALTEAHRRDLASLLAQAYVGMRLFP